LRHCRHAPSWRDRVHATDLGAGQSRRRSQMLRAQDSASPSQQEQGLGRLLRLRAAARAGYQTTRQIEAAGVSVSVVSTRSSIWSRTTTMMTPSRVLAIEARGRYEVSYFARRQPRCGDEHLHAASSSVNSSPSAEAWRAPRNILQSLGEHSANGHRRHALANGADLITHPRQRMAVSR